MKPSDSPSETESVSASSTASFQLYLLPFVQVIRLSDLRAEVQRLKLECGEDTERLRAALKTLQRECDQNTFEFLNSLLQHYEEFDSEEVEEEFNNLRQEYMQQVIRECSSALKEEGDLDSTSGATGNPTIDRLGEPQPHFEKPSRTKASGRSSHPTSSRSSHPASSRKQSRSSFQTSMSQSPERPLGGANYFQVGIAGATGRGKSSLLNALLGAEVEHTGAIELQQPIRMHMHPRAEALVLWEVPLLEQMRSERDLSDWFHANALQTLDALVVVVGTSLTEADRLVAKLARQQYGIPGAPTDACACLM